MAWASVRVLGPCLLMACGASDMPMMSAATDASTDGTAAAQADASTDAKGVSRDPGEGGTASLPPDGDAGLDGPTGPDGAPSSETTGASQDATDEALFANEGGMQPATTGDASSARDASLASDASAATDASAAGDSASSRDGQASADASGPPPLIQPIARANGQYVLEFGDIFFAVDGPVGARVVTLTYAKGPNLLTGPAQNATGYGSTFRTSPQSAWSSTGWPPPPEIDSDPYAMSVVGETIVGTSKTSAAIGAAVTKRFTPDRQRQTIAAQYTIQSTATGKSFAPWEVTRVFPGGLTFYPTGDLAPVTSGTFVLPTTQTAIGCTWFKYPTSVATSERLIADGREGWLAHVTADGWLFVKKFPDIASTDHAPGEGEISIYVDGSGAFVELENQGAYRPLAMGQSMDWTVTWYVRKLPANIAATVGNQTLVDYVRSLFN